MCKNCYSEQMMADFLLAKGVVMLYHGVCACPCNQGNGPSGGRFDGRRQLPHCPFCGCTIIKADFEIPNSGARKGPVP